jgi:hypothetical protein
MHQVMGQKHLLPLLEQLLVVELLGLLVFLDAFSFHFRMNPYF